MSETSLTSNEEGNTAATPVGSLPEEEYWQNPEWKERKKHVFILSAAGKPIYSRLYLMGTYLFMTYTAECILFMAYVTMMSVSQIIYCEMRE